MSVVALCGGVGGAKLALGLYRSLLPHSLTVIGNTGDDFEHLGLRICPDLDTVLYTLAGLAHPEQGWGRRDETWSLMRVIETLGEASWFRIGDADAALHLVRTQWLRKGATLSAVTQEFTQRLGVAARLVPMSDAPVETRLETHEGDLAFQEYFVKRRCEPRVRSIRFEGACAAAPSQGALDAFACGQLELIVLCPSNPYLSLDPILAIPGIREALVHRRVPAVAVSPLIGGQAVKGPTAKIMRELEVEISPRAIAEHYRSLIDGLVVDEDDAGEGRGLGLPVLATPILMRTLEDRVRLARTVLEWGRDLRPGGRMESHSGSSRDTKSWPC